MKEIKELLLETKKGKKLSDGGENLGHWFKLWHQKFKNPS